MLRANGTKRVRTEQPHDRRHCRADVHLGNPPPDRTPHPDRTYRHRIHMGMVPLAKAGIKKQRPSATGNEQEEIKSNCKSNVGRAFRQRDLVGAM